MRISTAAMQQLAISAILEQQAELSRTQLQVASGDRIVDPSDDPVGSRRILELDATLARIEQYRDNAEYARVRLSLEENALTNATQVIQRARELVIQANNDTQSVESRALIAEEIQQLANSLLDLANSQNGQGEYLFSGYRTETRAFSQTSAGVVYNGDQGQRLIRISDSQSVPDGDFGAAVFQMVATGNGTFATAASSANSGSGILIPGSVVDPTAYDDRAYSIRFTSPTTYDVLDDAAAVIQTGTYTSGETIAFRGIEVRIEGAPDLGDTFQVTPSVFQDMFTTLENIRAALASSGPSDSARAQLHSTLNSELANLDQAVGRLVEIRTLVGSRLSALDTQEGTNDEFELQLKTTLSDIKDLDFAEAVGRLNLQLTGLQAAQQAFARIQGLSLFNFL